MPLMLPNRTDQTASRCVPVSVTVPPAAAYVGDSPVSVVTPNDCAVRTV